ncbi:hypothetical protein PTR36_20020 [Serratia bockelmannii]|uniref:hypothetical protein n=1 Tax=Serratia TaxID=613 RepID=UPI00313CB730|nr:hypothetical protein [Serratia marcescens]
MRNLTAKEIQAIIGGLNLEGQRESTNVIDQRGTDMGSYIDANGACWAPGTPSATMYPNGGGPSYSTNNGVNAN